MMVRMIQDLGNKLVEKIDKLQETLNKEVEDIKIKQVGMKNTIQEIKKSSRMNQQQNIGGRKMNKQGGKQNGF